MPIFDFYDGTGLVDVDVYKVGHHGSANGTDEEFMQAISPQISVLSAGISHFGIQAAFDNTRPLSLGRCV